MGPHTCATRTARLRGGVPAGQTAKVVAAFDARRDARIDARAFTAVQLVCGLRAFNAHGVGPDGRRFVALDDSGAALPQPGDLAGEAVADEAGKDSVPGEAAQIDAGGVVQVGACCDVLKYVLEVCDKDLSA